MLTRFEVLCCFCCCCGCFVLLLSVATALDHRRQQRGLLHSTAESDDSSSSSSSGQLFRRSVSDEEEEGDGDRQSSSSASNGSASNDSCSRCEEERDAKRSYRLESVRTGILQKLRLTAPPNVTGRRLPGIPQLHKIISDHRLRSDPDPPDSNNGTRGPPAPPPPPPSPSRTLHPPPDEGGGGGMDDTSFASTIKYVLFAQPAPSSVSGNATNVFYFQFQSEMLHQSIVNASISVYVRRSTTAAGLEATWMLLYQLGPLPAPNSGESQGRETMRRRRIQMDTLRDSGQWITFDIRTYVERWIRRPLQFGIMVQMSDGRGEPLAVVQPQSPDERDKKPYLAVHVRGDGASSTARPRRTIDADCDEATAERRCCRYPLVIDFEQFGWDWIIVPRRYSAYYCSGECPFLYNQRYTHTGVAQQQQQQAGTAAAGGGGGPCCAPRKVSAISMLYYDQYMNIVYGRLPGMVVDQCGCS